MKQINLPTKDSKLFIDWACKQLEDDEYFTYILKRIYQQQQAFYGSNRTELLQKLREKMEKGAREHGNPLRDFKQIKKEIELEQIDLIGWSMIYAWALHKYPDEFKAKKKKNK